MNIVNNETNAYDVPHISQQLADYLKEIFSADAQIAGGLLSDKGVIRSEGYLLGFLAGLGFSRGVIDAMIANQEAIAEEQTLTTTTGDDLSFLNM